MNIITNIKKSYKHIPYSWKHYIMVMKLEKKYIGYYKYPFHDLDKIFMYIFFPFFRNKSNTKNTYKICKTSFA